MGMEQNNPKKKIYTRLENPASSVSNFISEPELTKGYNQHLELQAQKEFFTENFKNYRQKLSDDEWLHLSETIRNVRTLPQEERTEKLADIKETLAWFRFELGRAEKRIARRVYDEIPRSLDTLIAICKQELRGLPISEEMNEQIDSICKLFFTRNKKIIEMREEFPDDADLFKQLTQADPTGPIEILTTPVSFYIRAHTFHDFSRVFNLLSFDRILAIDPKHPDILEANKSLGAQISESYQPELKNALTAEKASGEPLTLDRALAFKHETQHALHKFFSREFNEALADSLYKQDLGSIEKDNPETYQRIIRRLFRSRLQEITERAKNEIFAMLAGAVNNLGEIEKTLTESSVYDYYHHDKNLYTKIPTISMIDIQRPFIKNENPNASIIDPRITTAQIIQSRVDEMKDSVAEEVFVDEYKKILHDGLVSINKLRKYGFDNELIIKILTHEPFIAWPKLADRMIIDYTKKQTP